MIFTHIPYEARMRFLEESCGEKVKGNLLNSFSSRCVTKGYFDNVSNWGSAKEKPQSAVYLLLKGIFVGEDNIALVHGQFAQPLMSPLNRRAEIMIFDREGNSIKEIPKQNCLDFGFYFKAKKIILAGNTQLLNKIDLDYPIIRSKLSFSDYIASYPNESLMPVNTSSMDNFVECNFSELSFREDINSFKLECYSYGADVVLNYKESHPRNGWDCSGDNYSGNLYRRFKESKLEKSLPKK